MGFAFECPAAAPEDANVAALLERTRLWESRGRLDLAREALNRLFRIARDHPDGLAALAEIEIPSGNHDAAKKALERLRSIEKGHAAIARIETLLRLNSTDKDKLREARLLARTGRTGAAIAVLRSVYPDGPPSGDFALEYWQLVAATPRGWEAARNGLTKLAHDHPDNLRYRFALAEHETSKAPVSVSALEVLIEMSRLPAFSRQAEAAWRRGVLRLPKEAASIPFLREYLAHAPGDTGVRQWMDAVIKDVEEKQQLMADPAYRAKIEGLSLLDRGNLESAEDRLQRSLAKRPDDADAIGAMGMVRLREGKHAEALEYFRRAQRLDPDNRNKWRNLARTARFWGLLRESKAAEQAGDIELAERKANEALAMNPREPNASIALARIRAKQGRTDEAEQAYGRALALAPTSGSAFRGLVSLHLDRGDREGAGRVLSALSANQRRALKGEIASVHARMLREDAERSAAAGRVEQAAETLEQAVKLDEDRPWVKYDLARLYVRQGDAGKGRALLMDQVQNRPDDAESMHALALLQSQLDEDMPALTTLERIPKAERSDGMVRLQRRVWVRFQLERAEKLNRLGRPELARRVLLETESAAADDTDLLMSVALAWTDLKDFDHARKLVDNLDAKQDRSPAWRLRYANLLARAGADDKLSNVLSDVAATPNLAAGDSDMLRELRTSLALRKADSLRSQGKLDAALQAVRGELAEQPEGVRLLHAEARILRALDRPRDAQEDYRRILRSDPNDNDAHLALIETLIEAGERAEAKRLIDGRLDHIHRLRRDDLDMWADLAGSLIKLDEFDRARAEASEVLTLAPEHPKALAYLGDLAQREERADEAIEYAQRSAAREWSARARLGSMREISRLRWVQASDSSEAKPMLVADLAPERNIDAERSSGGTFKRLADMLDTRTPWVSSAADWRFRNGSAGTSRLDARELPVEWKRPSYGAGQMFLHADVVRLNSGVVNLGEQREARNFGSVLLCQPACSNGSTTQSANGVALGVGYESRGLRLDLGTTPLGFPVQRLAGGIRYKGDLGPYSYSIDASSRPLTNSLLAYAGTRDPRTGTVWGGVQATGVRFGLSRDDGGAFGAWSSLGFHKLTGKNVQANDRTQLMAGAYWRVINEENRLFSVGITGMLWKFKENSGEYTFGHGGYYSPQSYKSVSFPVTFGERNSRFSYVLRAAVSVSRSDTKSAPFYPTDASLQSTAEALAAIGGADPRYGGGPGRGRGYSITGSFEYQFMPQVFFGTRLEIERSEFYAPNRVLLYTRYAFDRAAARPVSLPPNPVLPSWER
jgi:tetratricopeptide (TPR) repeat protein